jgi:hypothetical protein
MNGLWPLWLKGDEPLGNLLLISAIILFNEEELVILTGA